jgi:hypothetical protein
VLCESDDANASERQVKLMKVVTGEWLALKSDERIARIEEAKSLWDARFRRHKKSLQALACE